MTEPPQRSTGPDCGEDRQGGVQIAAEVPSPMASRPRSWHQERHDSYMAATGQVGIGRDEASIAMERGDRDRELGHG
jgi:hypothetical protein